MPVEAGTSDVVLSFIIPGGGQLSKGQTMKGVFMLAGAFIACLIFFNPIPWFLVGAVSAFDMNSNRRRS